MLALCDTSKDEEPVYWVWLHEAVNQHEEKLFEQGTLTIHIPVANLLNRDSGQLIEKDVTKFHTNRRIEESIGEVLKPALGLAAASEDPTIYRNDPGSFFIKHAEPLIRAGIVEVVEEDGRKTVDALPLEDQARFQKVQQAGIALRELRENDAERILQGIEPEVNIEASDYIKAAYLWMRGRLSQHRYEFREALQCYDSSRELRPNNLTVRADILHVQFALAWESQDLEGNLPNNWLDQVDELLSLRPNEWRLVRLRAAFVAARDGATEAEKFLRQSKSWENEKKETLVHAAYLYSWAGDNDRAEDLFAEAADLKLDLDALDWSLLAYVLLKKALKITGPRIDAPVYGPGPTDLDVASLRDASGYFKKAYNYFGFRGFPSISRETIVNYAIVLELLGEASEGVRVCRAYLDQNPDDAYVHSALAGCLLTADQASQAIPHATKAYDADKSSSLAFRNLASCLCQAEDYEGLIQHVEQRRQRGFENIDEEGFSLLLVVIALSEMGDFAQAERWVEHLESKSELGRYSVSSLATLSLARGGETEKVADIFRDALRKYPNDLLILGHLISVLLPLGNHNAQEVAECLQTLKDSRRLAPHEYSLLVRSYLTIDQPEKADVILQEAMALYPQYPQLMSEGIRVKVELGDETAAYELVVRLTKTATPTSEMLYDSAVLAANIGHLDKAIGFFERAAARTRDKKEQGAVHRYLFQLRMERRDKPVDILRHVATYGGTAVTSDEEAAYLIMFVLAPKSEHPSDEETAWINDFQKRLAAFTLEHPNFPGFKSITIPEDVPEDKKGLYWRAAIWSLILPQELATARLWQCARQKALPLVFRTAYSGRSLFRYWQECSQSSNYEDSLHVHGLGNDLQQEAAVASSTNRVCIDITALLTLAALDILGILTEFFDLIFLASGTRDAVWSGSAAILGSDPLARKIRDWMQENRVRLRIRRAGYPEETSSSDPEHFEMSAGGILLERKQLPLNVLLRDGVGESLLLAKKVGVPLFSDESSIRHWAVEDYGVASFSTLGLARSLVEQGKWTIDLETWLITELIGWNYERVPFSHEHLNSRLRQVLERQKTSDSPVTTNTLTGDEGMWRLFRRFGETSIPEKTRALKAVDWWVSVLESDFFRRDILVACMVFPTDCISRPPDNLVLLGKIKRFEREDKAARVLGLFLWIAFRTNDRYLEEAWSAIKECVQELFPRPSEESPDIQEMVLFLLVPQWLYQASREDSLDENQRTSALTDLTSKLPDGERTGFENALVKSFLRHD